MEHKKFQLAFFLGLLIGVLALCALIFLPYIPVLALAATLAFVMRGPYRWLVRVLGGQKSIAAVLTVLLTALLVLLPLSLIGLQVFSEARDLYATIAANKGAYTQAANNLIAAYGRQFAPVLSLDIDTAIHQVANWLLAHLADFFSGTLQIVVNILLGGIAFFYFLKDGESFVRSLIVFSPMSERYDREVLAKLGNAINSVMRGSLLVALIQGTLTGIGLAVFGVPNPTLWGSIAAVCALIPGVGTSLVIVPSAIFLFATGRQTFAFGLLVWGITAVGLIDNFLGPQLVGRGVKIHPLIILFAVIGGIGFFGPLGFLFGPLVISLLSALLDIYRLIVLKKRG